MQVKLIRYWFTFKDPDDYSLLAGHGVTAYTVDDAINIW